VAGEFDGSGWETGLKLLVRLVRPNPLDPRELPHTKTITNKIRRNRR